MNENIGKADTNFIAGTPYSNLFNWCADALLSYERRNFSFNEPVFCLLNSGGLRSGINKGLISIGDIYKLMPFDNNVVRVKLPVSKLPDLEAFLSTSSGLPIANAVFNRGKINIAEMKENDSCFWILTTDYLASGGDKMTFFQGAIEVINTNIKLRDVFIEEVRRQKTLIEKKEIRFTP